MEALGDELAAIEHSGSTAVPGLAAEDLRAYAETKLALSGCEAQEYYDAKAPFVVELKRRIGALTVVSLDKVDDPS